MLAPLRSAAPSASLGVPTGRPQAHRVPAAATVACGVACSAASRGVAAKRRSACRGRLPRLQGRQDVSLAGLAAEEVIAADAETKGAVAASGEGASAVSADVPWLSEGWGRDEPGSAWELGSRVFSKELDELLAALRTSLPFLEELLEKSRQHAPSRPGPPAFVRELTLDIDKVVELENVRGSPPSSPFVKGIFFALCWTLDRVYEGRPIPKFWVLETVARLPYFSYITVLHLYETLGWWRTPQLREVHNAEEDNELHHLLIMESLGGDSEWFDRFLASHASLLYYWVVVTLFIINPSLAYNFSLLVEEHALVTYTQFAEENRHILEQIPAPPVAIAYYRSGDLYYFDKFQTSRGQAEPPRRPPCDSLWDVFSNIRDDELEHVLTMRACQDWWAGKGPSPVPTSDEQVFGSRRDWKQWAAKIAALEKEGKR